MQKFASDSYSVLFDAIFYLTQCVTFLIPSLENVIFYINLQRHANSIIL